MTKYKFLFCLFLLLNFLVEIGKCISLKDPDDKEPQVSDVVEDEDDEDETHESALKSMGNAIKNQAERNAEVQRKKVEESALASAQEDLLIEEAQAKTITENEKKAIKGEDHSEQLREEIDAERNRHHQVMSKEEDEKNEQISELQEEEDETEEKEHEDERKIKEEAKILKKMDHQLENEEKQLYDQEKQNEEILEEKKKEQAAYAQISSGANDNVLCAGPEFLQKTNLKTLRNLRLQQNRSH